MNNFFTDVIQKDPRFRSALPCKDVAMLEPGTRAAVAQFIALGQKAGHDLRVAETFRSTARQQQLFAQHLTELKTVGVHNTGLACDIALYVNDARGKQIYDPDGQHYMFFQNLAVVCNLVSGIGWGTPIAKHTFTDFDHVQRVPIARQDALFAGKWYPDEDYSPFADMVSLHIAGMDASELTKGVTSISKVATS